jgi:hypothetical protein
MTDAHALRPLRDGGKEHFRRGTVRIFFQKMMLYRPHTIESQPVPEFDLLEHFVEQLLLRIRFPRAGQLILIKQARFHWPSPAVFAHLSAQRACYPPVGSLV